MKQEQGHNFERLKEHILDLSVSDTFEEARTEWYLIGIEYSKQFGQCPCGQEIKEHCFIRNRLNGRQTWVGNVCINRFMCVDTGTLFDGLRRIAKDPTANANRDLVDHAYRMGYLFSEKEYIFMKQMIGKKKFSTAQMSWKVKINKRILNQTIVNKRTVK